MNIIGPDTLVFGVENVNDCEQYLKDYGLEPVGSGVFEALDGTSVIVLAKDDASLPPALESGSMLRKTVYGVADQATLDAIKEELSTDREVSTLPDGSLEACDDQGFCLGFQITIRKQLNLPAETVNSPGAPPQRPLNVIGADPKSNPLPRTLSHVVYFVPDVAKAEAFYVERLGFFCTDRFTGLGPFLRPAGCQDHHTLFMIQTPAFLQGCEHFTFHLAGPTELLQAGTQFSEKGYETFWGPGRHIFGSNWFWYFNSPFGCHVEYDADMDIHDDKWQEREAPVNADTTQIFHFLARDKWFPSGPPPAKK
ncbi:MAG: glyoxalase [SAR86 cluster bacterium]|uniref:Glyoxalase n=1 Tax=SAR86 cluster bacterium TaxID=2030880 RepID=A0A2A5C6E6_9GAMM|nr:VOC family protein [Gammaproteobacteria bacterium AH-315-E17]PCJ39377.1 MAG: glyoxalase [SAR86 cluster bacterium]